MNRCACICAHFTCTHIISAAKVQKKTQLYVEKLTQIFHPAHFHRYSAATYKRKNEKKLAYVQKKQYFCRRFCRQHKN